jgi:hypothetical protein
LIDTISKTNGEAILYPDDDKKKQELNRRTQHSTQYAVIVTDSIYKEAARKYFKTPLIFSVQEAKGLEYDNVILLNFISNQEAEFKEIMNGVTTADLRQTELQYSRAADKQDKDAEIYKFYINSFYVAITRAIKNIYLFEKKVNHPVLQLLQLQETKKEIQVAESKSSKEEWLAEAQRLEEQGKQEQAEQIRARYSGYEYISAEQLEVILPLALDPLKKEQEVKKERKQLFQYAVSHQRFDWVEQLAQLQFQRAILYMKEVRLHRRDFAKNIRLGRMGEAMVTIKKYGINFITDEGATGLMLALYHGQHVLATELLKLKVSVRQTDRNGWMAIDYLMDGFYKTTFARQQQSATLQTLRQFWHSIKPRGIILEVLKQRIHVDNHSMLFFLLIVMRTKEATQPVKVKISWPDAANREPLVTGEFSMPEMEALAILMPDEILPPYRKNRSYINSVLAVNEISRATHPGCKMLFQRVKRGSYILNPDLKWEKME